MHEINADTRSRHYDRRNYPIITDRWFAIHAHGIHTVFFLGALVAMESVCIQRSPNLNNLPVELNHTSIYLGLPFVFTWGNLFSNYLFN